MTKQDKKEDDETKSDADTNTTATKPLDWTTENENIMIEWCDVAQCYKWLNTRSHQKYATMHAWFTIPAITLSTITGTASFAQTSLPIMYQPYAPMVIGTINIFIGILTTIQQYLKISELNESHRVAAIAWDKFARNIRIELAKSPLERTECGHFLKYSRQEYDRLMETSPSIHPKIVDEFNRHMSGKEGTDKRKKFDDLKKPDICDSIISVKNTVYDRSKDVIKMPIGISEQMLMNEEFSGSQLYFLKKAEELRHKEMEERQKEIRKQESKHAFTKAAIETAAIIKSEHKKIDDFCSGFNNTNGRLPSPEEIRYNFKDKINEDIIENYFINISTSTELPV
jgi:hypothetical protein